MIIQIKNIGETISIVSSRHYGEEIRIGPNGIDGYEVVCKLSKNATLPFEISHLKEIEVCKKWLQYNAKMRVTRNERGGSYSLKHWVEDEYKSECGQYISNGSFIKAALDMGYIAYWPEHGPNCHFNMSFGTMSPTRGQMK